jgi:tryptophanyl-tRNA synthetase
MRILSGITPSGRPHIGNYLGAIRQHISLQNEGNECFYFVADYHALTKLQDGQKLKEYRTGVALDYLALGLDPEKATLFYQSDVPEHAELTWILSCIAPTGLLERAHAWKDAKAKGKLNMNVGLFTYPILMAADILMYQPDIVPVGKDQSQHVEIARDLAQKFNHTFGDCFKIPELKLEDDVATIPGIDGQKMSKSYHNTIGIFEEEKVLKKQVMSIQTASLELADPMPLEDDIILQLYSHFATTSEIENMKDNYKAGGFGYGRAKKALLEKLLDYFGEARARRIELIQSGKVEEIMQAGKEKARKEALQTLEKVYQLTGLY